MSARYAPTRPALDIGDDTYVRATPERVAARVADPRCWRHWWPDLVLTVDEDRGAQGHRWSVDGEGSALRGSMEIWLEAVGDGTVVHWFLRAEPTGTWTARDVRRDREGRVQSWKAHAFALKDEVEGVKSGCPPADQG